MRKSNTHVCCARASQRGFPVLWLLFFALAAPCVTARPSRVILLRHAEKPDNPLNSRLSERGQTRARALVDFFATRLQVSTNSPPAALFATRPTRNAPSIRPRETLEPLASALKMPVRQPYRADEFAKLAKHLLESPSFDGKTVVVCWVHDELGDFARALGAKPKHKDWKSSVYDHVWVISFTRDKVRCKTVLQKLLPGDETKDVE